MSVTMTLSVTKSSLATVPTDRGRRIRPSSFSCSSTHPTCSKTAGSYTELAGFFTDKPVQGGKANTYTRNQTSRNRQRRAPAARHNPQEKTLSS